ncbi:MAG: hypothetical protein JF612_14720, partial [Planctomycetia bacterium]|nr:hypothetical protein [Planctomycetia bacterium]
MSKHSDLDYAQHYLILLTDLLAAIEGGRHWPGPMAQMAFLCREAKAALSDLMW